MKRKPAGCGAMLTGNSFIGSRPSTPWCPQARPIFWPGSSSNPNLLSLLWVNAYNRLLLSVLPSEAGVLRRLLMDTLHRVCAGLDVHKDTVVACVRRLDDRGRPHQEVKTFGATTPDLLELLDWLLGQQVPLVAMESTGVYWKPIFNLLEGPVEVLLVNPEHIKKVPGRKTDVKDCEWIAQLLQHGLLKASFVPPRPIRELRELTRQRSQLVGEKASVSNRIQKALEDANIKLGSVASDVLGVSGRDMLRSIIAGVDSAEALANLARGRLRDKLPPLRKALTGRVTEHHRFLLGMHLDHLTHLEALIGRLDQRIGKEMEKD